MKQILIFGSLFLSIISFGQNNTYPFPQNGSIGIGTTSPQAKLDVVGKIIAGSRQLTYGEIFLEGRYAQGTAYGSLIGIGSLASSGNAYWGYGVKPTPYESLGTVNSPYLSSTNIPIGRAVLEIAGAESKIKFLTGVSQTSTDGGSVNLVETATMNGERFGVGITNPKARLDVREKIAISRLSDGLAAHTFEYAGTGDLKINNGNGGSLIIGSNTISEMARFDATGNLGIGAADTKGYKLAVNGDAIATRVVVKLYANWPDYVFKPDYKLPPLSMVEQHIKEKGHLPNIPSEKEVADNGIDLGSMSSKLLQKVEELTLYLIDMEKRLKAMEIENTKLKADLDNHKK
jgi:hypothetical protein